MNNFYTDHSDSFPYLSNYSSYCFFFWGGGWGGNAKKKIFSVRDAYSLHFTYLKDIVDKIPDKIFFLSLTEFFLTFGKFLQWEYIHKLTYNRDIEHDYFDFRQELLHWTPWKNGELTSFPVFFWLRMHVTARVISD